MAQVVTLLKLTGALIPSTILTVLCKRVNWLFSNGVQQSLTCLELGFEVEIAVGALLARVRMVLLQDFVELLPFLEVYHFVVEDLLNRSLLLF